METTNQGITDALFGAHGDAKYTGVPVGKVRWLVDDAYDLSTPPVGPLTPCAGDEVNERMRSMGEWGASL